MKMSGDRKRAARAAAVIVWSIASLMGCSPTDTFPIVRRQIPVGGFGVQPSLPPTSGTGVPVPISGMGAIRAGTGTAGIISVPTAGVGAGAGVAGTGNPNMLPAFDAGSDPNRNHVRPGGLCQRVAAINCAGEAHCCLNPGRTVDACKTELISTCTDMLYVDQIAMDPVTRFDESAAEVVFTALELKASMCDPNIAAWAASPDGLRSILRGSLAPGANCKPAHNFSDPPVAGAALASCTNAATTACLFTNVLGAWTCAPKNGLRGACDTDANCNDGLYCSVPAMTPPGTCETRLPVGSSCSDGSQCASLFCKKTRCVAADVQVAYCLKD